jgi:hypothetical protein
VTPVPGTGGLASVDGVIALDEDALERGMPLLELPPEPEGIRVGLRDALLDGADWRAGFSDDICVGVWLWSRWQPALEPAGCTREEFVDIVVANRRELWLWLVGDRRWEQYVTGLAGRVLRRLPPAPVT